jgi:hypothetical protein
MTRLVFLVHRCVRSNGLAAAVAAALVLAVALPRSVAARPDDGLRVRHGAGIGRLKLGMSYAEVRRILGGPQTVDRRERLSGGRRYLELSWDFGWWTVGFMGKPNRMRAVSIQTLDRRERTVEGLGVGSRERTIRRRLRVRCLAVARRSQERVPFEVRCAYASHRGRETAFVLGHQPGLPPWDWGHNEQVAVAVRIHLRSADYCFRGPYTCQPVP